MLSELDELLHGVACSPVRDGADKWLKTTYVGAVTNKNRGYIVYAARLGLLHFIIGIGDFMNVSKNRFKQTLFGAIALSTALIASPAMPQRATLKLSECLVGNTTGYERVTLVQWIFYAISSHPAVSKEIATADKSMDEVDRKTAGLFNELLLDRCRQEVVLALRFDGDLAIEAAFGTLGEVAMAEVMTNANVNDRMMKFADYIDELSISKLYLEALE